MNIGSREIVLWLSEPQHQALTRALGEMGTDIETIMQARPGGAATAGLFR